MRIAIDLMGGDQAPEQLFQGVLSASKALTPDTELCPIVLKSLVSSLQKAPQEGPAPLRFIPVDHAIAMGDSPLKSLRQKRGSSLEKGMSLLNAREVDAFISVGNTGALVAHARILLKRLPGIFRPALLARLPAKNSQLFVLDVGANVTCQARQFLEFAQMGLAYLHCFHGMQRPRLALLNIGEERGKGPKALREAYQALEDFQRKSQEKGTQPFDFLGNIEGSEAFKGQVDLLLTDGFTGNVFLKTAEGVSHYFLESLKGADLDRDKIRKLAKEMTYSEYPGAILCGVEGLVIKCHGYSGPEALFQGIMGAHKALSGHFLSRFKSAIAAQRIV